ncbi:hypothetical protein DFH08DRAFT_986273 [Mycena albidolilacea]|uniref:Uncharacterized protein n=1 Tax=Mycena albidolilacea TaxID=1033008 RepID=A0AAD7E9W5_9AGAR|nr:hypothetical protein DFH08DRAFT_986273 [Mycena albidolilacea]
MRTTEKSEYRYKAPAALGIAAARRPLHKKGTCPVVEAITSLPTAPLPRTRLTHAARRPGTSVWMAIDYVRKYLRRDEPIVQERARQRVRIVQTNRQLRPRLDFKFAETREKSRIDVVRQLRHAERLEAGDVVGVGLGYLDLRDGVDARTARLDHADERGVHLETRYLEMLQPREEREDGRARRVYKLAEHVGRVALVIARTVVDGEADERRRRGQNVHDASPAV